MDANSVFNCFFYTVCKDLFIFCLADHFVPRAHPCNLQFLMFLTVEFAALICLAMFSVLICDSCIDENRAVQCTAIKSAWDGRIVLGFGVFFRDLKYMCTWADFSFIFILLLLFSTIVKESVSRCRSFYWFFFSNVSPFFYWFFFYLKGEKSFVVAKKKTTKSI